MRYLNQLKYGDMYYPTSTLQGGAAPGKDNVKAAGCGLCCLCMIVENMTFHSFPLQECLDMSVALKANEKPGTDLKKLGPAVAGKFGLDFKTTNDSDELLNHLRNGGMAIANSGGDRDGYEGVFTHGGHYVTVISANADTLCVLDPSLCEGKFDTDGRRDKVRVDGNFVYCDLAVLAKDCENRDPAYYLFGRR